MDANKPLNLPDSFLKEIHCSLCKGYLSCAPVRVLPNGTCICGRCQPPSDVEGPIYRVLTFEAVLKNISFPCQLREHGCKTTLPFGLISEHEIKCEYRLLTCPVITPETCSWTGPASKIITHFRTKHLEAIRENANFKIQVDKNSQELFVVVREEAVFLVKYEFTRNDYTLKYSIGYIPRLAIDAASYKINLINDATTDCMVALKTNSCCPFDDNFNNTKNTLFIHKYLDVLDKPKHIQLSIDLKITIASTFDELELLKCPQCNNFLVPPLFDLNGKTICCDCKIEETLSETTDVKIQQMVQEARYPCRWPGCYFVDKSNTIRVHEVICKFRRYSCKIDSFCSTVYDLSSGTKHLERHKVSVLSKGSYVFVFTKVYIPKWTVLIEDNTIIPFYHFTSFVYNGDSYHTILLQSDSISYKATARLGHKHCKIQSKPFTAVSGRQLQIYKSQLPPCFTATEEITVTISNCRWTGVKD